jgi:hypothetical protein
MPGRGVHGKLERSQSHYLLLLHDLDVRDLRHDGQHIVLGIIPVGSACREHARTRRTYEDPRAGDVLNRRNASGMIEMRVRIENDPDIARVEAERANVAQDVGR